MNNTTVKETRIYLNTWGAYNNGCIGYGWMTPEEALDFMEQNPERDGGEWFIADIDNYLGIDIYNLEYCNVGEICEAIQTLEEMDEEERRQVVACMEYLNTRDVQQAIDLLDRKIFFSDLDSYHNYLDEIIEDELQNVPLIIATYFDYSNYHESEDCNIYEASNGVVIL